MRKKMVTMCAVALAGVLALGGVAFAGKKLVNHKYDVQEIRELGGQLEDERLTNYVTQLKNDDMIFEVDFSKMNHAALEANKDDKYVTFYRIREDALEYLTSGYPYFIDFGTAKSIKSIDPDAFKTSRGLICDAGYVAPATLSVLGGLVDNGVYGWKYIDKYENSVLGGYYYYMKPVAPGDIPKDIISKYCSISSRNEEGSFYFPGMSPTYEQAVTYVESTDVYEDGDYLEVWKNLKK